MKKRLLYLLLFIAVDVCYAQTCPPLVNPLNDAENVPLDSRITWEGVDDIRGYYIIMGTAVGLRDIADRVFVGTNNFFDPVAELPDNAFVYVRITLSFSDGRPDMTCNIQRFHTGTPIPIPECTRLTSPANDETGVALQTPLEWPNVANASAYRVTIGTTEGSNDFLDATFDTNSTPDLIFEANSRYYVTITPFNSSGDAVACAEESFTTILECDPFVDPDTGILVDPRPEIDFPDEISICLDAIPATFVTDDEAEGFRWFRIDSGGSETLISEAATLIVSQEGTFRYEAYNTITRSGGTVECSTTKIVTVNASEIATISDINITRQQNFNRIEVNLNGSGVYEYALNNENGPYRDENSFANLNDGLYTVFVRDKNGCGIVQEQISVYSYPKFFTPNADGKNDTWHLAGATNIELVNGISIFDRYGKLIRVLLPDELGWDGNYNGAPLPSSDYWFKTALANGVEFKGHFTLKR